MWSAGGDEFGLKDEYGQTDIEVPVGHPSRDALRNYCRFTHSILFHGLSMGKVGRLNNTLLKHSLRLEFEADIQFYQLDIFMRKVKGRK